jgi:esterase/lipase superfamily enzyme
MVDKPVNAGLRAYPGAQNFGDLADLRAECRPMQRLHFILVLAAVLAGGCATQQPVDTPAQVLVPVYYATNRNLLPSEEREDGFYGDNRGDMSFGKTVVALSTRKEGDSPFADWSRWEPRKDESRDRNELLSMSRVDANGFADMLAAAADSDSDRSVLLFIHGFRRSFDIVATEVAAIAFETNIRGIPMFFSWPSANSSLGYASDVSSIRWAAADLRDTLKYLLSQESIENVHVVAHSLGGDGLLAALEDLSRDDEARVDKLGEIVLASPDVDAGLFERDYLPGLLELEARVTLYATDNDVPLQASERVNRYRRLGDAKAEIFIAESIETIVFADIVTFMNSHDAVVEIGDLQADLHYLLEERLGANERPTLTGVNTDRGRYWRVRPLTDER